MKHKITVEVEIETLERRCDFFCRGFDTRMLPTPRRLIDTGKCAVFNQPLVAEDEPYIIPSGHGKRQFVLRCPACLEKVPE